MAPPEPEQPPIEPITLAPPVAPAPVEAPPAAEMTPVEIAPAEMAPVEMAPVEPVEIAPVEAEPVEIGLGDFAPIDLPADPFLPATELVIEPALQSEPAIEPSFLEELETPQPQGRRGTFTVVVRLSDGEGVEIGEFRDFGTAMEGAQEVIEQFANANGSWPFYAGRFIRPDLIVSVDVVDA
jgi:hypothetical protein